MSIPSPDLLTFPTPRFVLEKEKKKEKEEGKRKKDGTEEEQSYNHAT